MRAPVTHSRGRTGLIGTALCIGVLSVVARLAAPDPAQAAQISSGDRLATSVDAVRSVVGVHRLSNLGRITATGWPAGISPDWFPGGALPIHPDTGEPFTVEVVDGRSDEFLPAVRTFDLHDPSARSLWYNRTNGSVCARVVDDGEPASVELRFARANGESRIP